MRERMARAMCCPGGCGAEQERADGLTRACWANALPIRTHVDAALDALMEPTDGMKAAFAQLAADEFTLATAETNVHGDAWIKWDPNAAGYAMAAMIRAAREGK